MSAAPRNSALAPDADAETLRVREAYARRVADGRYGWDRPGHVFMMQDLERRILRALARHGLLPLADRRVLEIGCGNGHFLRELVKWGADPRLLTGIDVIPERLAEARRGLPPQVRLEERSGAATGLSGGAFDLILQMTVFTSILDPAVRRTVAREMVRLLAPGGAILWYDFRVDNPRNPDVRGVSRSELAALFPACSIDCRSVTLAPPLARTLAPRLRPLCLLLSALPPLRTHYLAVVTPAGGTAR